MVAAQHQFLGGLAADKFRFCLHFIGQVLVMEPDPVDPGIHGLVVGRFQHAQHDHGDDATATGGAEDGHAVVEFHEGGGHG